MDNMSKNAKSDAAEKNAERGKKLRKNWRILWLQKQKKLGYGNRKQRWEPWSGKEKTERHREHRVSQSYLLRVIVLTVKIKMFTPIFQILSKS